jgi:hypothetical protein
MQKQITGNDLYIADNDTGSIEAAIFKTAVLVEYKFYKYLIPKERTINVLARHGIEHFEVPLRFRTSD